MASPITVAPDIWSKAGSDAEYSSPALGGAWTKEGTPTYSACKFDNGTDTVLNTSQKLPTFNRTPQFSLAYFFNPSQARSDASAAYALHFFDYEYDYYAAVGIGGDTNAYSVYFYTRGSGANGVHYKFPTTWIVVGTISHIVVTYDKDAAAGSKAKLIVDGVEISASSYTEAGTGDWGTGALNWKWRSDAYRAKGVYDNPQKYAYALSTTQAAWLRDNESWTGGAEPKRYGTRWHHAYF